LELFSGTNPGVQGINSPLQQHYPAGTESTPAAQNALAHGDDFNTGQPFSVPNLGAELLAAGKSFAGYSEDLPSAGFTGVSNGVNGRRRREGCWHLATRSPAFREYPVMRRGQSGDRWALGPASSTHQPSAC